MRLRKARTAAKIQCLSANHRAATSSRMTLKIVSRVLPATIRATFKLPLRMLKFVSTEVLRKAEEFIRTDRAPMLESLVRVVWDSMISSRTLSTRASNRILI